MELQEIWKDIKGYEGLYQVSNLGRVKTLYRRAGFLFRKERILRQVSNGRGYLTVGLSKNGHTGKKYVHRLVAESFVPNPSSLPCINHKDYNKSNNVPSNLEWCTYSYNNTYSDCQNIAGASKRIPVAQCDLEGNVIKVWESATKAGSELKISNSCITACCKGRAKSAYGYIWKYA